MEDFVSTTFTRSTDYRWGGLQSPEATWTNSSHSLADHTLWLGDGSVT